MQGGDENSRMFHRATKARKLQSIVYCIHDMDRVWRDKFDEFQDAYLSYYKCLLGNAKERNGCVQNEVINEGTMLNH